MHSLPTVHTCTTFSIKYCQLRYTQPWYCHVNKHQKELKRGLEMRLYFLYKGLSSAIWRLGWPVWGHCTQPRSQSPTLPLLACSQWGSSARTSCLYMCTQSKNHIFILALKVTNTVEQKKENATEVLFLLDVFTHASELTGKFLNLLTIKPLLPAAGGQCTCQEHQQHVSSVSQQLCPGLVSLAFQALASQQGIWEEQFTSFSWPWAQPTSTLPNCF